MALLKLMIVKIIDLNRILAATTIYATTSSSRKPLLTAAIVKLPSPIQRMACQPLRFSRFRSLVSHKKGPKRAVSRSARLTKTPMATAQIWLRLINDSDLQAPGLLPF